MTVAAQVVTGLQPVASCESPQGRAQCSRNASRLGHRWAQRDPEQGQRFGQVFEVVYLLIGLLDFPPFLVKDIALISWRCLAHLLIGVFDLRPEPPRSGKPGTDLRSGSNPLVGLRPLSLSAREAGTVTWNDSEETGAPSRLPSRRAAKVRRLC